jgi:GNAT superfamily N-acetyltransferase
LARWDDIAVMRALEIDAGRRFADVGLTQIAADDPFSVAELSAYIAAGAAWVAVPVSGQHGGGDDVDDRGSGSGGGGGAALGYAAASVLDGHGHLDQVSVGERQGRRGVGRALVETVCAWAAAQGFDAVTLTTFRDVAWNAPLYARWGFATLDEHQLGPELSALRRAERARGLDLVPRVAMRRLLGPGTDTIGVGASGAGDRSAGRTDGRGAEHPAQDVEERAGRGADHEGLDARRQGET